MDNPYIVLGIAETATDADIKAAFRQRAKETHPDLHGGSAEKERRFKEVNEAYKILSDPVRRKMYDSGQTYDEQWAGFGEAEIKAAINAALHQMNETLEEYRKVAIRKRIAGFVWLSIGIVVTLISLGAGIVVMWGAMLYGGLQLYRASKIDEAIAEVEKDFWNHIYRETGYTRHSFYNGSGSNSTSYKASQPSQEPGTSPNQCRACGFEWLDEQTYCPRCGTPRTAAKRDNNCSACGFELFDNQKFCPKCGTLRTAKRSKNLCHVCGFELRDDQMFCPKCGSKRKED